MSTTYSQLKEAVKALSGVTDAKTINLIPLFIRSAETSLAGNLRSQGMTVTKRYPEGGLTVPIELTAVDAVMLDGVDARLVTRQDVLAARKLDALRPAIYAVVGVEYWLVEPAEVTIVGYQSPPNLSDTNQTNAFTQDAENALLFQSLAYLCVHRRDSKGANVYQAQANSEMADVNARHEEQQKATGVDNDVKRKSYF